MVERWKRQLIRDLFPYSRHRLAIERAYLVKHPHIPTRLYKYREFKESHLDALREGALWCASPDSFNDPYDMAVQVDPNRFLVEDQTLAGHIATIKEMQHSIVAGKAWTPAPLRNPLRSSVFGEKLLNEALRDTPASTRDAALSWAAEYRRKTNEQMVKRLSLRLRSGFGVLALTPDPLSILMWSHYAASHQGFCIEYDFAALPAGDLRRRLCYPVFYRRRLTDASRYLENPVNFNNLFGLYLCLVKSDEWVYENEWRIVYPFGPSQMDRRIQMPKPSAIVLGCNVRSDDEQSMREFCRDNSVPLRRVNQVAGAFRLNVEEVPL